MAMVFSDEDWAAIREACQNLQLCWCYAYEHFVLPGSWSEAPGERLRHDIAYGVSKLLVFANLVSLLPLY